MRLSALIVVTICVTALIERSQSSKQCPWSHDNPDLAPLNEACLCSLNLKNEYSVQCSSVNFPLLMGTLHVEAKNKNFDLLFVNNTKIALLGDKTFFGFKITSIQLSSCSIYNITADAFQSIGGSLENLNLQDNLLEEFPTKALASLHKLRLLDLSGNRLIRIPANAFKGLHLNTLKMSSNDILLDQEAFSGLENDLKNLNLKNCKLTSVPYAVRNLHSLAFLDLAQNEIRSLQPGVFETLHSLTALNLERNFIQDLHTDTFLGVTDTLSSLSLLNNLLTKFPLQAIQTLPHLRVLDIGFNLISSIPDDAFSNANALTLLAVDGNPLVTLPVQSFQHLNGTLRGLSLGGHHFKCDCNIKWIIHWIRKFDLQVTSRDREPQYCGYPSQLRHKTLYDLKLSDLKCDEIQAANDENESTLSHPTIVNLKEQNKVIESVNEKPQKEFKSTHIRKNTPLPKKPESNIIDGNKGMASPPNRNDTKTGSSAKEPEASTYRPQTKINLPAVTPVPSDANIHDSFGKRKKFGERVQITTPKTRNTENRSTTKKAIVREINKQAEFVTKPPRYFEEKGEVFNPQVGIFPQGSRQRPSTTQNSYFAPQEGYFGKEVIIQDAFWDKNAIHVQWDSEVTNILGFRVVYRLFGDKYFKMGQPLSPTVREFKIKNVPINEYFVACVVSLEEVDVKLENVPFGQCREIRTGSASGKLSTHMDKIIIAASASICGTVIIAVLAFLCCYRRKYEQVNEKQNAPAVVSTVSTPKPSVDTTANSNKTDWDTISMYSQRSIPRARMYHHQDKEDTRSHISHLSRSRSMADGQSQRSFSRMSGIQAPSFMSPMNLSRPDLRLSHQSLAHSQYGSGYIPFLAGGGGGGMISRATSHRSDRRRSSRSRSRERTISRPSYAGSVHSLTGYDTDGWTDHDMDIYMARNPTRGGLVQL